MSGRIVSIYGVCDLQADIGAPGKAGILAQGIVNMLFEHVDFQVPKEGPH